MPLRRVPAARRPGGPAGCLPVALPGPSRGCHQGCSPMGLACLVTGRKRRRHVQTGTLKEMMSVGKIAVHEFITLDGVIEDPSWSFDYSFDSKMGEAIGEIMGSSEALLLGRRTYQEFAPSWSTRTAEEDPGAPFMNGAPKYVVSGTLQTADWNTSTLLGPYSPESIRELKTRNEGNLYATGGGSLARAMLADGLFDELHLFVYPLAHVAGHRLFSDGGPEIKLALAGSGAYSNGVLHLTSTPVPS